MTTDEMRFLGVAFFLIWPLSLLALLTATRTLGWGYRRWHYRKESLRNVGLYRRHE